MRLTESRLSYDGLFFFTVLNYKCSKNMVDSMHFTVDS